MIVILDYQDTGPRIQLLIARMAITLQIKNTTNLKIRLLFIIIILQSTIKLSPQFNKPSHVAANSFSINIFFLSLNCYVSSDLAKLGIHLPGTDEVLNKAVFLLISHDILLATDLVTEKTIQTCSRFSQYLRVKSETNINKIDFYRPGIYPQV